MQGRSRARTAAGVPRPAAATTADANTGVNSNGLDANANAKGTKLERTTEVAEEELPFERRAREEGRPFRGGKSDGAFRSSSLQPSSIPFFLFSPSTYLPSS